MDPYCTLSLSAKSASPFACLADGEAPRRLGRALPLIARAGSHWSLVAVGLHREFLTSYGTWPESLLICSRGTIGHQRTPEPGASLVRPASHASFPQVSFVQWREEVKGMAGRQSDCYLGCFKIDSEIQIPRFHETLPPALAPCWGPECSASFMISFFRNPECCLLGIT